MFTLLIFTPIFLLFSSRLLLERLGQIRDFGRAPDLPRGPGFRDPPWRQARGAGAAQPSWGTHRHGESARHLTERGHGRLQARRLRVPHHRGGTVEDSECGMGC